MRNIIILGLLGLLFLFATPAITHAYIDPGTGGMLLQILIGVIVGSFFAFRHAVTRIFRRIFPSKDKDPGCENKTESPQES